MSLALIWAEARGGVIGYEEAMPWHLPEDLAHFRELTSDAGGAGVASSGTGATRSTHGMPAVLMGRRTWDALPERFRPLPGRRNLVLTRDASFASLGAEPVHDPGTALASFRAPDAPLWIIGGGELYRLAMRSPLATRLEVTELDLGVKGDTFAPPIDASWSRFAETPWLESRTGIRYRFVSYAR